MNSKKIFALVALLGFCVSGMVSCTKNPYESDGSVPATGIYLDKEELSIRIGQVASLKAYVQPEEAANQSVTWTSSDPSVVIVDILSGNLRAISKGTADIVAETEDGAFQAVCKVTVKNPVSVYAVGGDMYGITMWKDGEPIVLSTGIGTANSVCLDGDDVYVAGYEYEDKNISRIWKNGELLYKLEHGDNSTFANSVFAENGNVYACGYTVFADPRKTSPIMWTNGESTVLPAISTYAEANAVAARNGKAYVAGYDFNPDYDFGNYIYGVLWHDGDRENLTEGDSYVTFTDMFIDNDGKLYISGNTLSAGFVYKDGTFVTLLSNKGSTVVTSVCVYEGDVYACGYIDVSVMDENGDTIPRYIAAVWKNEEITEFTDGTTAAMPVSICVRDGDVYIGGNDTDVSDSPYVRGYAVIWKNCEQIFKGDYLSYISDMALTD